MKKTKPSQKTALQIPRGPIFEVDLYQKQVLVDKRQAFLYKMYHDDIAFMIAVDAPEMEPRQFFVKNGIDYSKLTDYLVGAWEVDAELPYSYKAVKRIPESIIQQFKNLSLHDRLVVIDSLRQNEFLPSLTPLKKGTQPLRLTWPEVAGLCYSGKNPQAK